MLAPMMRTALALFVLVAACSGKPVATDTAATPEPTPAPTTATPEPAPTTAAPDTAGEPDAAQADGSDCMAASECASGVCEGEGCDAPGKCMPASRPCTKDLRQYCGCDGQTFSGSGSCPGARFSKREAC